MYRRSELRHACFRAKNKVATEENRNTLKIVEPLLQNHQRWDNFSVEWDLLIDSKGEIVIIKPEIDYDFIHTTCLEVALYKKNNISLDGLSDRQKNIILTIEALMLDSLMTWNNYGKDWGIEVDQELKAIKTKLYKTVQNEVTDQMIKASMKDADGSAFTEKKENVLEMKPMTDEQKKAFEQFLAKQYPQKG